MSAKNQENTLAGLTLAFEMMGRAYEALALLGELHHPGEYKKQNQKLKDYIADNFRHVESALTTDEAGVKSFREAVLMVREVFDRVDAEVLATHTAYQSAQLETYIFTQAVSDRCGRVHAAAPRSRV